jgi:hypothetical protein
VRYSRFGWQSRIKSRIMSSEVLFSRPRHAGSSATVERREPQRRDIRPVHPKAWPPRGLAPGGPDLEEMVPKDCAPEGGLRATFTDPTREPRDLGELELECQVCTRQRKVASLPARHVYSLRLFSCRDDEGSDQQVFVGKGCERRIQQRPHSTYHLKRRLVIIYPEFKLLLSDLVFLISERHYHFLQKLTFVTSLLKIINVLMHWYAIRRAVLRTYAAPDCLTERQESQGMKAVSYEDSVVPQIHLVYHVATRLQKPIH